MRFKTCGLGEAVFWLVALFLSASPVLAGSPRKGEADLSDQEEIVSGQLAEITEIMGSAAPFSADGGDLKEEILFVEETDKPVAQPISEIHKIYPVKTPVQSFVPPVSPPAAKPAAAQPAREEAHGQKPLGSPATTVIQEPHSQPAHTPVTQVTFHVTKTAATADPDND